MATGGHGPYTFTVTNGTLPPGLTLEFATGKLSGMPTAEGVFTFTITATDSKGCTGKRHTPVEIKCPEITIKPAKLPNAMIGHPYSKVLVASGGNSPYVFSISQGTLPTGLTLSSTGTLSGTPTVEGNFNFTVVATDRYGCSGKHDYTIFVKCSDITLNPTNSTLPNAAEGHPYSKTFTASGGISPYTFVAIDPLPNGLSLTTSGVLSGAPTTSGSFYFTIRVTDSFGCFAEHRYFLYISPCPTITVNPTTLSSGTVGVMYNKTITATGGSAPYTFVVMNGTIPPGLALSTGGSLSGTPTAAGSFTFVIMASDNFGCGGKRNYTVSISGPN